MRISATMPMNMFQSLSGFLMSCNEITEEQHNRYDLLFQSLSGFLMSCNKDQYGNDVLYPVFQSLSGFLMSCNIKLLKRGRKGRKPFQSLSGFLMSCNFDIPMPMFTTLSEVSIPIGFSNEL